MLILQCYSHKCGKIGHIAKVYNSAAVIVTSQEADDSAVVPISQTDKQPQADIPPMFQILHLTEMQRPLRLMLDSASPLTFVNVKTWQDLDKPKLTKTERVLGAFDCQSTKPLGYFTTTVVKEDDSSQSANLPIYVSHKGVSILGRDGLAMLNIAINPTQISVTAAVQVELNNLQQVLDLHTKLF